MQPRVSKLGLGAAQFRFEGAIGARGRSPTDQVAEILSVAHRAGLDLFDAAAPYPSGESILGEAMPRPNGFRIMVKTARCDRGPEFIESEARASLQRLGVARAYGIVVQSAGDLFGPHGPALWDKLQDLKDQGLFEKVGVAALASDDPAGVARRFKPDILQAPVSLLDQRLLTSGALASVRDQGVEVQLRSIFMQGLLFLPLDRMPAPMKGAAAGLSRVRRMIAEGRSDPLQAALGFALSRQEAASVIVSVTTAQELQAVIAAASSPPPDLDWEGMAIADPAALDGRWAAA
ncbi:MAG: bifunctional regulator KidO [Caulobacteraceae bacterium]|nr:bifunctional regulator KidO [Caulobacteraceae bacterium]